MEKFLKPAGFQTSKQTRLLVAVSRQGGKKMGELVRVSVSGCWTRVLPVPCSLVLLGSLGSQGSLDAPLQVLHHRDLLPLEVLLGLVVVLLPLLHLPHNCQEIFVFCLVIVSSMLACDPLDCLDNRLEVLDSRGDPSVNTVRSPGSQDNLGTGQELGPPGPPYSRHWTLSQAWAGHRLPGPCLLHLLQPTSSA